jgi:hypothetical protein
MTSIFSRLCRAGLPASAAIRMYLDRTGKSPVQRRIVQLSPPAHRACPAYLPFDRPTNFRSEMPEACASPASDRERARIEFGSGEMSEGR